MNKVLVRSKKLIRNMMEAALAESPEDSNILLNEAINFHTHTIFVAIPKTGTTAVRRQLAQRGKPLIPNPHLNIVQLRDTIYTYLLVESLGKNKSYPTIGVQTDAELRALSDGLFSTFFKFAAVRNPWARAVSLYMRREGIPVRDKMSFKTFCENHTHASDTCRQPTLHRNQLDWLCDESGQCVMDYIYKLEEFDSAVCEIAHRTNGRVQLVSAEANVNPYSDSKRYRDIYTDYTRRLIEKRFCKDIDFFKYSF